MIRSAFFPDDSENLCPFCGDEVQARCNYLHGDEDVDCQSEKCGARWSADHDASYEGDGSWQTSWYATGLTLAPLAYRREREVFENIRRNNAAIRQTPMRMQSMRWSKICPRHFERWIRCPDCGVDHDAEQYNLMTGGGY